MNEEKKEEVTVAAVEFTDEFTDLRTALAELSLATALMLSDVARMVSNYDPSTSQAKQSEARVRAALELAKEALSK